MFMVLGISCGNVFSFYRLIHYWFTYDENSYNNTTVKLVLSGHEKKRPKIGFQDRLSLTASQKNCRMLQKSILQYFRPSLSYHMSLKTLCLFVSGHFRQVLLHISLIHNYLGMFSKSHSFLDGVAVPDLFNSPVNDTGVLGSNPRPSSELWLPGKLTSLTITGFPLSENRRKKHNIISMPASCKFCCLLITMANNLDPDQA